MTFGALLREYWPAFAAGLQTTLALCGIVWLISFTAGCLLGLFAWRSVLMRRIVIAGSFLVSGVPAIVVLFWAYYPGQALLRIEASPFLTACVSLSIIGIFLVAASVHRTLVDFPRQYWTAALVCGFGKGDALVKIVLPIVMREFTPTALTIIVNTFHMSFFAAFISVDELFRATQRVNSVVYQPIEIYTAFAIFCLLVSLPLYGFAAWLRSRSRAYGTER